MDISRLSFFSGSQPIKVSREALFKSKKVDVVSTEQTSGQQKEEKPGSGQPSLLSRIKNLTPTMTTQSSSRSDQFEKSQEWVGDSTGHPTSSLPEHEVRPVRQGSFFRREFNTKCQELLERSGIYPPNQSVYAFSADIANPKVPMNQCVETEKETSQVASATFKVKKKTKGVFGGLGNRVKIVRFKDDPIADRWFAMRRPRPLMALAFQQAPRHVESEEDVKLYRHTLDISLEIGPHPNFMQVQGLIIKERKEGKCSRPYLISEHIEGQILRKMENLNSQEAANYAEQLKVALLHLFDKKIEPRDTNLGNFMITTDHVLKLIDFEAWQIQPALKGSELAQKQLNIFKTVFSHLAKASDNPKAQAFLQYLNSIDPATIDTREKLASLMDQAISQLRS